MKIKNKIFCLICVVALSLSILCPSAFAREFAPVVDTTNIGVHTQYKYEENDPSWIRQLTIKEDMLSSEAFFTEETLFPVTSYPYTADAPFFKAQVEEYIDLYTLDEDSQKAAYLYMLEVVGALNAIANPEVSDKSKADWLREQGIIITPEDEKDQDKILMIGALYSFMKNDWYYVYSGEHLTIPKGTPLEEAVVMYLTALSDDNSRLTQFILKYFGTASIGNLDTYIYYTSLMALYSQGYVSALEIATISRNEVYRRVAIMTIRNVGIAIDAETATTQEINHKYLAAMLSKQYAVTIEPDAFKRAIDKNNAPYYILQRMAYEDAKVTISATKYSYEECFKIVLQKTQRFDLENEFYSDIYEYDVHLDSKRKNISINPNPISKSGIKITINGVDVTNGSYALVELTGKAKETITIISKYTSGKNTDTSIYKINVHQGTTDAPDSDLTGLIPTLGNFEENSAGTSNGLQGQPPTNVLNNLGNATAPLFNTVLILNENGQLVDQYGNIVSDSTYETLPEGYDYVLNDDGIVTVVLTDKKTTEPTTLESDDKLSKEDGAKIVIIVSLVCFVLILAAIITVAIIAKKKNNMAGNKTKEKKE